MKNDDGCALVIFAGILVIPFLAFLAFLEFINETALPLLVVYWPWLVALGVAVSILMFLSSRILRKRRLLAEALAKALAAEERERFKQCAIERARVFFPTFAEYLKPCCVIDASVWMNEKYNSFFEALSLVSEEKGYCLELYGPQFDEITNLTRKHSYGEQKNKRSRLAISRIEYMQKRGCLRIRDITLDARRGVYADPIVIKVLRTQAEAGMSCVFFTDDKELRIRVRQILTDIGRSTFDLVEVPDILTDCEILLYARKFPGFGNH